MSSADNNLYEFGDFRLDPREGVLRRGEEVVILPPKVFETLFQLVKKEGGVVSKTEMLNTVWADSFVEESNLTQNIYTLRKTLGSDRHGQPLIETVARRGYRLAVPVRVVRREEAPARKTVAAPQYYAGERTAAVGFDHFVNDLAEREDAPARTLSGFLDHQQPFVRRSLAQQLARSNYSAAFVAALGALLLLVAGAGFAVYWYHAAAGSRSEARIAPIEQIRLQRLTDTGDVLYPTISPNGEVLAYVRATDKGHAIWLKQLATGGAVEILPPAAKPRQGLVFSPDGNYLFYREPDGGAIYRVPAYGGAAKKIAGNAWTDFGLSPDGRRLAFIRQDTARETNALVLAEVDGGENLLAERGPAVGFRVAAPVWSPDGAELLTTVSSDREPRPLLAVVKVDGGAQTEIPTPRWQEIIRCLWMPDGRRLIVSARAVGEGVSQIWMYDFATGDARRLTNDLENYIWVSLSADGRRLVARQQQMMARLWLLPAADLNRARPITDGERRRDGLRGLIWTGANRLVYTAVRETAVDLYAVDPDGANPLRLTDHEGDDNTYPTATADGRTIVFTSHRKGARRLFRMEGDGRDERQLTAGDDPAVSSHSAAVTADGREVYFIRRDPNGTGIWKMPLAGGDARLLAKIETAAVTDFLALSPDGKWLAFRPFAVGHETGGDESAAKIGLIETATGRIAREIDLGVRRPLVQWSRSSDAFYYIGGSPQSATIFRQALDGRPAEKIVAFPDRVFNFAFSPDGKDLAVARGRMAGDAVMLTNLP